MESSNKVQKITSYIITHKSEEPLLRSNFSHSVSNEPKQKERQEVIARLVQNIEARTKSPSRSPELPQHSTQLGDILSRSSIALGVVASTQQQQLPLKNYKVPCQLSKNYKQKCNNINELAQKQLNVNQANATTALKEQALIATNPIANSSSMNSKGYPIEPKTPVMLFSCSNSNNNKAMQRSSSSTPNEKKNKFTYSEKYCNNPVSLFNNQGSYQKLQGSPKAYPIILNSTEQQQRVLEYPESKIINSQTNFIGPVKQQQQQQYINSPQQSPRQDHSQKGQQAINRYNSICNSSSTSSVQYHSSILHQNNLSPKLLVSFKGDSFHQLQQSSNSSSTTSSKSNIHSISISSSSTSSQQQDEGDIARKVEQIEQEQKELRIKQDILEQYKKLLEHQLGKKPQSTPSPGNPLTPSSFKARCASPKNFVKASSSIDEEDENEESPSACRQRTTEYEQQQLIQPQQLQQQGYLIKKDYPLKIEQQHQQQLKQNQSIQQQKSAIQTDAFKKRFTEVIPSSSPSQKPNSPNRSQTSGRFSPNNNRSLTERGGQKTPDIVADVSSYLVRMNRNGSPNSKGYSENHKSPKRSESNEFQVAKEEFLKRYKIHKTNNNEPHSPNRMTNYSLYFGSAISSIKQSNSSEKQQLQLTQKQIPKSNQIPFERQVVQASPPKHSQQSSQKIASNSSINKTNKNQSQKYHSRGLDQCRLFSSSSNNPSKQENSFKSSHLHNSDSIREPIKEIQKSEMSEKQEKNQMFTQLTYADICKRREFQDPDANCENDITHWQNNSQFKEWKQRSEEENRQVEESMNNCSIQSTSNATNNLFGRENNNNSVKELKPSDQLMSSSKQLPVKQQEKRESQIPDLMRNITPLLTNKLITSNPFESQGDNSTVSLDKSTLINTHQHQISSHGEEKTENFDKDNLLIDGIQKNINTVVIRNQKWLEQKISKLDKQKEDQYNRQLEGCTFKPVLIANYNSNSSPKKDRNSKEIAISKPMHASPKDSTKSKHSYQMISFKKRGSLHKLN